MGKLKVLQIVTRLVDRGVPRHVLDLASGLVAEGYEVDVLAGRSEAGEHDLWGEARRRGLDVHYVGYLQRSVGPAALPAYLAILRLVRAGGYDVVHTHISMAGFLGRLAAHRTGVPAVVHTYHGSISELHLQTLKSRLYLASERRAATWADALVAVSQHTACHYQDACIGVGSQYRVIHHAIDASAFRQNVQAIRAPSGLPAGRFLGAVASLTPEKGLDVLIRAMPLVLTAYPDARLCILGDGILRVELEQLADQCRLGDKVHFVGHVADVGAWLATFQLLVLPSKSEGWPTAILEAMAMELPVVASRVGGIPELVREGETGCLVEFGDVSGLAAAIIALLRDDQRRRYWGLAARTRVDTELTQEAMIAGTNDLYREILDSKHVL